VAERGDPGEDTENVETLAARLLADDSPPGYGDTLALFAGLVMAEKPVAATLEDAGVAASALSRVVVEDARLSAADRLDIYAHMYFYRIHDVLYEYLPCTAAALGEEAFWNLLTTYLQRYPSRHPSLRYVGQDLARFVAEEATWSGPRPWLSELVALEWARVDLVDRRDADVMSRQMAQAWGAHDMAALPLRLVPAALALPVGYAVDELWRHLTDGPVEGAPETARELPVGRSPRTLLVWRSGLDVYHRVADPDEATFWPALFEGTTFGKLCDAVAVEEPDEDASDTVQLQRAAARAFALAARWIDEGLLVAQPAPAS
jgi:hypothetical protein